MDYIEAPHFAPDWLLWLLIAAAIISAIAFLFLIAIFSKDKGELGKAQLVSILAAGVVFIISCSLGGGLAMPDRGQQREALAEQIQSHYGIDIAPEKLRTLGYPRLESPTSDFEALGSIDHIAQTDDGLVRREIFLIWDDGEFYLAESQSKDKFEELPTAK